MITAAMARKMMNNPAHNTEEEIEVRIKNAARLGHTKIRVYCNVTFNRTELIALGYSISYHGAFTIISWRDLSARNK